MRIYHTQDVPHVSKPEGTTVTYFLFPEYEIHVNIQKPHTTQTWHHHEKIWESIYIMKGELVAKWHEDGREIKAVVRAGDVIETERSPHTFSNETDTPVRFLVIKRVPTGKDCSHILKTDKVTDQ